LRFPSLQHSSAASRAWFVRRQPASGRFPLRRCFALAGFRWNTNQAVSLEVADVWGGSFDDVSSHREDATPIVFDLPARSPIGETDPGALARSPAICRASPLRSCRPIASCTGASFSAVFRYAEPDIRGLAGRSILLPSYQRPAALLGFGPSQVYSRNGWIEHFCRPGPTCRFRCVSAPIDFRRVTMLSLRRRRVRLLGLTPICDPHPAAHAMGSILPWALPLAGFAGTQLCA
jgi:hypothetical protein